MRAETHTVLNGQGFVKLVDVTGTDDRIVETARLTAQSLGKDYGDDRGLIRYLMRHLHTTPVEFGEITVHVRVPMDCWRQWIRHRTASVNEFSTRYSDAIDERATIPPDEWRLQSKGNRQGSSGTVVSEWPEGTRVVPYDGNDGDTLHAVRRDNPDDDLGYDELWAASASKLPLDMSAGEYLSVREAHFHKFGQSIYQERLAFGVANEVARKDLLLSTFTEAYWKTDLHNLLHFLHLRMDPHAQKEIREYADIIGNSIVRPLFPRVWDAFLDYRHEAVMLTRLDRCVIDQIMEAAGEGRVSIPVTEKDFMYHQYSSWQNLSKCRERDECLAKLRGLGIVQLAPE